MNSTNPLSSLRADLLGSVSRCLTRYSIPLDGPVILGLSGGKDSLSLLFLLSAMGVEVYPVIVDLGYLSFDAEKIASSILHYGFKAEIVHAHRPEALVQLSRSSQASLTSKLAFLAAPGDETPCGSCSQVKRTLLLAVAESKSASWIVLGHHRDDLLSTTLKDYFAYLYHQQVGLYDFKAFSNFVRECRIDADLLKQLIERKLAATMSIRLALGGKVELLRPMAFVEELQTESFVHAIGIQPFGSGCSHESFQDGQLPTKREIVHLKLRDCLRESPELGEQLLEISLKSLDPRGRILFNPRSVRHQALPGFDRPHKEN